jgi:hypothetical protein
VDRKRMIEELDREIARLQQARALLLGEEGGGLKLPKSRNVSQEASRCIALTQKIRHKKRALKAAKAKAAREALKADLSRLESELADARAALANLKTARRSETMSAD